MKKTISPIPAANFDVMMDTGHAILEDKTFTGLASKTNDLTDSQLERSWAACTALAAHFTKCAFSFAEAQRRRHGGGK